MPIVAGITSMLLPSNLQYIFSKFSGRVMLHIVSGRVILHIIF